MWWWGDPFFLSCGIFVVSGRLSPGQTGEAIKPHGWHQLATHGGALHDICITRRIPALEKKEEMKEAGSKGRQGESKGGRDRGNSGLSTTKEDCWKKRNRNRRRYSRSCYAAASRRRREGKGKGREG